MRTSSQSAREAIRAAQANGHKFLSNTGRARSEVPDLGYLGLDGYCFAAGAEVILDGEHVVNSYMDPAAVRAATAAFDAHGLNYNIGGGDQSWIAVNDQADFDYVTRDLNADGLAHALRHFGLA